MKKVYRVCSIDIESKEVCVPSTDYYSKGNDWQTETLNLISINGEDFETEELAIKSLEEYFKEHPDSKGEYTILPFYKK